MGCGEGYHNIFDSHSILPLPELIIYINVLFPHADSKVHWLDKCGHGSGIVADVDEMVS